jgi:hypothetical protein
VESGELRAVGEDQSVEAFLDQSGMLRQRFVERGEQDSLALERGVEVRCGDGGVVLDLEPGPVSHLTHGRQDVIGHVVQGFRRGPRGERREVEVEVREVSVSPLLGLLRGDGQGPEVVQAPLPEALDEWAGWRKGGQRLLVEAGLGQGLRHTAPREKSRSRCI